MLKINNPLYAGFVIIKVKVATLDSVKKNSNISELYQARATTKMTTPAENKSFVPFFLFLQSFVHHLSLTFKLAILV